jgi:hypothetical protein
VLSWLGMGCMLHDEVNIFLVKQEGGYGAKCDPPWFFGVGLLQVFIMHHIKREGGSCSVIYISLSQNLVNNNKLYLYHGQRGNMKVHIQ